MRNCSSYARPTLPLIAGLLSLSLTLSGCANRPPVEMTQRPQACLAPTDIPLCPVPADQDATNGELWTTKEAALDALRNCNKKLLKVRATVKALGQEASEKAGDD